MNEFASQDHFASPQSLRAPKSTDPRALTLRAVIVGLGLAFFASATGCHTTAFYERQALVGPLMSFEQDPSEVHFYQKCLYSREGAVGGVGDSAGGGCGCY